MSWVAGSWEGMEGGGGETIIVDGTATAQIIDSLSATSVVELLQATIIDYVSSTIESETLTAVIEENLNAS